MRNFNQHGVLYGITPKVCMEFCAAGMESTHGVAWLRLFIKFAGGRCPPFLTAECDETVKIYVFAKKF